MKKILTLFIYLFFIITLIGCDFSKQKKELNSYKEGAITSIDSHFRRYDSSLYSESQWNMMVEYINEGKKQIKISNSIYQIDQILNDTIHTVQSIKPSNKPVAPINPVAVPKMEGEEPFTVGDGTLEEPYIIDSKGKFIYFSNCVNNGIGVDDYYELKTNIDLKGIRWIPIGALYYRGFEGHFNGNGYEISNFEIFDRLDDYVGEYVGIFGRNDGVIENLGVINLNIDIEWLASSQDDDIYAGGLAGINEGAIINCYSIGKMNFNYRSSKTLVDLTTDVCAGGISGKNNDEIYSCYSQIDIKIIYEEEYQGLISMAGISYNSIYGEIKNCLSIYTGKSETWCSNDFLYNDAVGGHSSNSYFYYDDSLLKYSVDYEGLNQVEFYTNKLGWSQDVWDFRDIAFEKTRYKGSYLQNKHPKLRKNN